ncbi:hypothetical protein [Sphingomonas sp. PR090111-T3T-6A]|uniref:hypothetical protein n=1 Tax=Sphingomonas sp. PR090111-T3T-6A TaxID=685778 RepID=UPI0012F9193E|nr:hypothetical protein [Sphingomonas sp. PR090111-T3T-6A]
MTVSLLPERSMMSIPRSNSVQLGITLPTIAPKATQTSPFSVRPTVEMGRPFRDSRLNPGVSTRSGVGPQCLTQRIVPLPESRHKSIYFGLNRDCLLDARFPARRCGAKIVDQIVADFDGGESFGISAETIHPR